MLFWRWLWRWLAVGVWCFVVYRVTVPRLVSSIGVTP